MPHRKLTLADKDEIHRLYWIERWPQARIGKHYKTSPQAIGHFMNKHSIPTRPGGSERSVALKKSILELYPEHTPDQIAEELTIKRSTVITHLRQAGLGKPKPGALKPDAIVQWIAYRNLKWSNNSKDFRTRLFFRWTEGEPASYWGLDRFCTACEVHISEFLDWASYEGIDPWLVPFED